MTTKEQTDIIRARSPQQWRLLINQVPKDIRAYVARLVWWDWFSHNPEEIKSVLQALGYPKTLAENRI
jgi:hypothetical protein